MRGRVCVPGFWVAVGAGVLGRVGLGVTLRGSAGLALERRRLFLVACGAGFVSVLGSAGRFLRARVSGMAHGVGARCGSPTVSVVVWWVCCELMAVEVEGAWRLPIDRLCGSGVVSGGSFVFFYFTVCFSAKRVAH